MSWQIVLGILVIIQVSGIVLTKLAADRISKKSVGVFYQYLFCSVISTLYAVFSGNFNPSSMFMGVTVGIITIGILNAIGNYFQWQTSALSLSKTALFFPMMEVVTIVLAVIFLGEDTLWNIPLVCGIVICFLVMLYFRFPKNKENQAEKVTNNKWFIFAIAMIFIFGVTGFFLKFFSNTVPRETFLMEFYLGSFVGSIPLLLIEKQNPLKVSRKMLLGILPISIAITSAVLAIYWAYQLGGPVSLVIPVKGLAITVIPILVGWLFLKEGKGLSIHDWLVFGSAIVAVVLILTR